jgi:hypothetical protein
MPTRNFNVICCLTAFLFFSSCNSKIIFPRPAHIVIVIEENHGYDEIINSANAPYPSGQLHSN